MISKFVLGWTILSVSFLLMTALIMGLLRFLCSVQLPRRKIIALSLYIIVSAFFMTLMWIGVPQGKGMGLAKVPSILVWIGGVVGGFMLFQMIENLVGWIGRHKERRKRY